MSPLEIIVFAILGFFVILGFLFGMFRGWKKSSIRTCSILVAVVLSFLLKNKATYILLDVKIEEQTLKDYLISNIFTGDLEKFKDSLWPLFQVIISIVVFLLLLVIFMILSYIIFAIIASIFARGEKKYRLVGGVIGALSGFVYSFVLVSVLTGFSRNVEELSTCEINGNNLFEEIGIETFYEETGFEQYNDSEACKVISKGDFIFQLASKTEVSGKEYCLDDEVLSVKTLLKFSAITSVDTSEGLNSQNVKEISDVLRSISDGKLPEGVATVINDVIKELDDLVDIDLSNVDISKIDFNEAANLLEQGYEISTKETVTEEEIKEVVETAVKSGVIDLFNSVDAKLELEPETKDKVVSEIEKNTDLSDEDKNALLDFFGAK